MNGVEEYEFNKSLKDDKKNLPPPPPQPKRTKEANYIAVSRG